MFVSSSLFLFSPRRTFSTSPSTFEPLEHTARFPGDPFIHERRNKRTHIGEGRRKTHRCEDADTREMALLRQGAFGLAASLADSRDLSSARDRAFPVGTSKRSASMTLREVL